VFRGDFVAGRRLLRRAADLLDDSPHRIAALPWLGVSLYSLGDYADADRVLTEAADSGGGEDATISFFVRALGRGHNPVDGETISDLERAVRSRITALGDASPLAYAEGYNTLSRLLFWQGRTDEMLEAATRARDDAVRAGVVGLETVAAGGMAVALTYGASPWVEYEDFARAVLADRDRLGRLASNALGGLALAAAVQGRFDESERLFAEHEAELRERGDERGPLGATQNRGFSRYLSGDLVSAEQAYREGWDAYGALGERGFRATLGTLMALALLELGRRDEAEAVVAESEEIAPEDDWLTHAGVALMRARFATADGRHDEAVTFARRAVELAEQGYFMLLPWFTIELGRALAALSPDDARTVLTDAVGQAQVKGSLALEARAQALLDDLGR
jgi:tetratricopeptide (TPR) repeat protein